MGKTLAEMGLVSPADLAALALERVRSMLHSHSLFLWTSSNYDIEERDVDVASDTEVLYPSVYRRPTRSSRRCRGSWTRCSCGRGSTTCRRCPAVRRALSLRTRGASRPPSGLLQQVNGASTIETIVAVSPDGEEESLRGIYALLFSGILEIEGVQPAVAAGVDGTRVASGASATIWKRMRPTP